MIFGLHGLLKVAVRIKKKTKNKKLKGINKWTVQITLIHIDHKNKLHNEKAI